MAAPSAGEVRVAALAALLALGLSACAGAPKPDDPGDMQAFLEGFSPDHLTFENYIGAESPADDRAVVYFEAAVTGRDDRLWRADLQALEPSGWHVTRIVENDCDPAGECWGWHNLMQPLAAD